MKKPDEPIRILRLIARLNVGGPALHVSYVSRELDELGYQTTLVTGRVGASEGSMEAVAEELGVSPLYLPELRRDISPLLDVAAVRRVRALIRELRPQILHTHTAKAGTVGRVAAALSGDARPAVVVHTFHGHVLRGYFGSVQSAGFLQIERRLAAVSDALVAVSPEVRDDLVRLGVATPDRITVIRLGLDLDGRVSSAPAAREEIRAELGIPTDAFVVGWFGRMTEIKRADDLLRAFALLRAQHGQGELLLVGDGPLASDLRSLGAELGVASHLHFTGYRADVGRLYAATDVVALTSANEGTPVTLIEALAASRPVVSTDVGGVVDVVADGRSGFLVPAGNVEAVADRLSRLADDPQLRASFGAYGSADVRSRYSIPRLVADLDALYTTLLERNRDSARRSPGGQAGLPRVSPRSGARTTAGNRLRIIIVSQYFPPEIGATQSRMQSFAEHLADRGHRVTVICEFPNHPQGIVPEAYRGRLLEDDRSNAYRILRVWVKTDPVKTQRNRMAFYLSFMGLATAVAPLAGRADVVLATTPPLFTGLAGLAIARMNAAPLVLDVRDLWPAAATSLRQISSGWETTAAEEIERRLYESAALVVAVTRPFCEHIDALRSTGPPTVLIPNGTLEQFFASEPPGLLNRFGVPPERFLVTFAGTLGIAQALPTVLEAAALVADIADVAFVGDGPMKQATVAEAARRRLTNVHFQPQVPVERIPPILAASDAMLVPLSAHPTFEQFVPSKLIDFMASGRPVLLAAAGESARILGLAGAGLVLPPENPAALADGVRWLREHPEEARVMGQKGREFARRRLRSVQAERLEQALLDITAGAPDRARHVIAFVTIPKPFTGDTNAIQRNAIASWLQVAPDVSVLLIGDEPGLGEAAESPGVRQLAPVARTDQGTPRLDSAFALAAEHAGGRLLCYVNADILLPPSLAFAAEASQRRSDRFLVIGECWNVRVDGLLDAASLDWKALSSGSCKRGADALDYFLFSPGLFTELPGFAVGRTAWDNWLVWKARSEGAMVVDATSVVRPIHQHHDYGNGGSLAKVRNGPEAAENRRLAGGRAHLYSRYDATHRLLRGGLVPNPLAIGHAGETVRRGWAKIGYRTGLRAS